MRRVATFALVAAVLAAPPPAAAEGYYNEQGDEIHWMTPNFPFGIVRGALTIAQGPLEYFPAAADFMRKQKTSGKGADLGDFIVATCMVAPIGSVIGSVLHALWGTADIVSLGLCSDGIYSEGVVTPLIWEEKGFLKSSKITKRSYAPSRRSPTVTPPRPPETGTPSVPTSAPISTSPSGSRSSAPGTSSPLPTSAPLEDDD